MKIPKDLFYTKTHEWVKDLGNGKARVGVTDHAQDKMGDVVYVELPAEGDSFAAGDELAVIETQKATAEVYAPMAGTVFAVNGEAVEQPERINEACYETWLVELTDAAFTGLLTAGEYEAFLKSGEERE